jgi:hypothetical protein
MQAVARRAVLVLMMMLATLAVAGCDPAPPPAPAPGSPFGAFDQVWQFRGDTTVWATGWAIDPDTTAPIDVHVYVDGVINNNMGESKLSRPDVGAAYPGYGDAHGFHVPLRNIGGPQEVCAYAINGAGSGDNTPLGCRVVAVSNPLGGAMIDASDPGGIRVRGWARDLDTADPATVTVAVTGRSPVTVVANGALPVPATMPAVAAGRGFDVSVPAPLGQYEVVVTVHNQGPGDDSQLSRFTWDRRPGVPLGQIDLLDAGVPGQFRVAGWAFDPDSPAPIDIEISVQGVRTKVRADRPRPDVAAPLRRPDPAIGFDAVVPTNLGQVRVCVIAKDTADERDDNWLGCQDYIR